MGETEGLLVCQGRDLAQSLWVEMTLVLKVSG